MLRSRTKQHIENKEKPTRFFYAVEKQNQNKKNITRLRVKNGDIKTEDQEILKIAKEFYSDQYKKSQTNKQEQESFLNQYDKKMPNNWHTSLKNLLKKKNSFKH